MRFADSKCKYTEVYQPEHAYIFKGRCISSGKDVEVKVKAQELYNYRQGALIQNALVSNTAQEREFLISGLWEWDNVYESLD